MFRFEISTRTLLNGALSFLALAAIIGWYEFRHPRVVPRIFERWEELKSEGSAAGPESHEGPRAMPRNV